MKELPIKTSMNLRGFVLTQSDAQHSFFKQYETIRDWHYIEKHCWETEGTDQFDQHSEVVVLVDQDEVIAGCRMIHDSTHSLPIRELLRVEGKSLEQVPTGSIEASRFGISPRFLGTEHVDTVLGHFVTTVIEYAEMHTHREIFAVLISILEARFRKQPPVAVHHLKDGVRERHGKHRFNTVRLSVPEYHSRLQLAA
jgi:N-acyl-L-homoserine lactone synthetase